MGRVRIMAIFAEAVSNVNASIGWLGGWLGHVRKSPKNVLT